MTVPPRSSPPRSSPPRSSPSGTNALPPVLNAPWLRDADVRAVIAALAAGGAAARFVGGCVRNALIGAGATDVDVAVDVPPDETTRLLEAAGLRAVPTGVEHGTVTAVSGAAAIEVTTLRRDVETDGRRAVVAFTTDWAEDARRRDFTMNALYADGQGRVFDPLGDGLADLAARRVRFIGRAEDRIREDYLRILRFYRFAAWYGEGGVEAADVAAIAALKGGISGLARERIGQEIKKLLAAEDPAPAVARMADSGVLAASAPPLAAGSEAAAAGRLAALVAAERALGVPPDPIRRIAALADLAAPPEPKVEDDPRPKRLAAALRLANAEEAGLRRIAQAARTTPGAAGRRFGEAPARDALLLAAGSGAPLRAEDLAAAVKGAASPMPISAKDLIAAGLAPGPKIGAALRVAEEYWIGHNFDVEPTTLLAVALASAEE